MNGKINAYTNKDFSFGTTGEQNVWFIPALFSRKKCTQYLDICDSCATHFYLRYLPLAARVIYLIYNKFARNDAFLFLLAYRVYSSHVHRFTLKTE